MIFFGHRSRVETLKSKAALIAMDLADIQDSMERSLAHSKAARELSSWRHFWVALHKDEAWVAISLALVAEQTRRSIHRSGPHSDYKQLANDMGKLS